MCKQALFTFNYTNIHFLIGRSEYYILPTQFMHTTISKEKRI